MADIPSSSKTIFRQSTALTGWTKLTSFHDYMLRIVSGTVGSGGTQAFSSVFGTITPTGSVSQSGTAGAVALDVTQLPSHAHDYSRVTSASYPTTYAAKTNGSAAFLPKGPKPPSSATPGSLLNYATSSSGSTDTHSHPLSITPVTPASPGFTGNAIDFGIKYVDVILAQRN